MKSISLLNVRIDDVTTGEVMAQVEQWMAQPGVRQIATVNPEFIMRAQRDAAFAAALRQTDLNVPDGIGVLLAARRLGQPLRERVAGVDLMLALCARAAQQGWPVYLLGAQEGVAEQAALKLQQRYAGLKIAGTYAGSPNLPEREAIVARVRQAQPRLLFVAYGAPAQDVWLAENLPLIRANGPLVGMGVGGSFDFVVGTQQRAPLGVQRMGLEWLYRLLREPRRWRRQLALPQFAALVMLESFRRQ